MVNRKIVVWISLSLVLASCKKITTRSNDTILANNKDKLPILSPKVDGKYNAISNFKFTNQFNKAISEVNTEGKVYIAEFFFTSCPSICPLVSKQLQRVYESYKNESNFMILSHTIDPEHDTVTKLLGYYSNHLQIETPSNWHLLTGKQNEIYDLANFSYGVVVYDDKSKLKDNIMHSGALLLVDQNRLIRGMYDGKDPENIDRLIKDVEILLGS